MARTVYHETLWSAVQSAFDAIPHRHAVEVEAARTGAQPMAYETSQKLTLALQADETCPRSSRKRVLSVCLYRMASGRYEVTAYAA